MAIDNSILIEFMTETAESLGEIKSSQREIQQDIKDFRPAVDKIPLIEKGLNNHLSSHNALKKYFMWPVSVAVGGGLILALLRFLF